MSAQAATQETTTPTGQVPPAAIAPVTPVEGDKSVTPAKEVTKEAKPAASGLGDLSEPEKKADGEQGKQGDESKDGKSADASALEIKLPDGVDVDSERLDWFKGVAKEVGLTSEGASKLVAADFARQAEALGKLEEKWAAEIKADKDVGGDKYDANLLAAKGFLRRTPEGKALSDALARDYLGNYPPLFKFVAALANANKEDSASTSGGKPAAGKPSANERDRAMYPSMFNEDGSPKK